MLIQWSKKWGSVPTCTTEDDDEVVDSWHIRNTILPVCIFPRVSRTCRDTNTREFSATLMNPSCNLQVRPLGQRGTTRPWQRSLLHIEMEASLWFGFVTSHRRKILRQTHGRLLMSLYQISIYTVMKASLTRWEQVLVSVMKGELWSPNFMLVPRSRIKNVLKYKLCYQPVWTWHCLDVMNLGNSCISETEITPPSNLVERKWYQKVQVCGVRNELLCIKGYMSSCTNVSLEVQKTLICLLIGRIQGDVICWCWRLEPNCCWVARKISNSFRCWHLGGQRHRWKKCPNLAP